MRGNEILGENRRKEKQIRTNRIKANIGNPLYK
jgi:hypothetical protein